MDKTVLNKTVYIIFNKEASVLNHPNNILLSVRGIIKFYDQYMEAVRIQYQLSHIEITIISFLHNHPGRDTARDICEMRMLPKGNVSQGVESLIQKGLLFRTPDEQDRRRIHLSLTESSIPIVQEIEHSKEEFAKELFHGLTAEEIALYRKITDTIVENTKKGLERK